MTPFDTILHQSPLHLLNYLLVAAVLFRSLWQAFTLRVLQVTLHLEAGMLIAGTRRADTFLHPIAKALLKKAASPADWNAMMLRQAVEHFENVLFAPLRSQITLTRDLSTLMGLVATCAALVTAGGEFAKHGRAELLIGSVAAGTISTCIAAVGCMLSLWTGSRLTQLRVRVASEIEEWLSEPLEAREPSACVMADIPKEPGVQAPNTPATQEEINYAI